VYCKLSAFRGGEIQPQPVNLQDILAYCELFKIRSLAMRENIVDAVQLLESEARKLRKADAERAAPKR